MVKCGILLYIIVYVKMVDFECVCSRDGGLSGSVTCVAFIPSCPFCLGFVQDGRVVRLKQSNSVVVGGARTKSEEGEAAEEHSRSVPHFERERDRARRLVSSIL